MREILIMSKNLKLYLIAAILLIGLFEIGASITIKSAFADETVEEQPAVDIEKSKKDLVISGGFYYRSKKYEAALHEWETALALDPQDKKVQKYIKNAKAKIEKAKKKEEKKEERKDVQIISVTAPPKEPQGRLSLDDCVEIAIENHIPLQIAEKNIKLGEMRCWEARRGLLPTVTARWEEVYGKVNARNYYGKKEYIEGQQPIFHGGELYFTMRQSETNLKIVKEEYSRIKNDLTLQVKKGYYTLAKAKENLKMQAALKDEVDIMFGMVKEGFEGGAISQLEFLNVSSQESQVNFQLSSAQGDVEVADLILKQTMNVDPKDTVDIEDSLEFKKMEIIYEDVLRVAFMNRPEMKINAMMVEYYKYGKNIARAKGLPKIDAMGSWGLAKEEYRSIDNNPKPDDTTDPDRKLEQEWYAGIKVSMPFWGSTAEYSYTREQWTPVISTVHGTEAATQAVKVGILDNLKYYSDKQAADIDFDRARQEFNKIKQDVTLEAKEGCFNYAKAVIQLDTAAAKVKYQEKDLELMKLKRGMDEAQDSNVIDSMIKLSQERFGYVQAVSDCLISLAAINKAIGVNDYFKTGESESGKDKDKI